MRARYLITEHPGAYIRQLGFLVPGQYFDAPAEDYVPARSFRALNEEASVGLKRLKGVMLAKAKEYQAKSELNSLTSGRREAFADAAANIEAEAARIDVEIAGVPKETEVKVSQMVSLKAMDEAERGKGKRAADQR